MPFPFVSILRRRTLTALRSRFNKPILRLLHLLRFNLLSKNETIAFLEPLIIAFSSPDWVELPRVADAADPDKTMFTQDSAISEPSYVWSFNDPPDHTLLLPLGGVIYQRRALCTDYEGQRGIIWASLFPDTRRTRYTDTLLAPWSHSLNGVRFGGYYDFMILVAAKLCRMKEALPNIVFRQAIVAYPLFDTHYEHDFLDLLGIDSSRTIDSRVTRVRANQYVLGNSGDWIYPNVADMMLLKKTVEASLKPVRTHYNRVYISRAGRRRVVNEDELIAMLRDYDFTIIYDEPRSLAEQVSMYKNASFILGPHGASFTNVIWCEPGTHLLELFSPRYVPGFFRYLAQIMDMRYSAYSYGSENDPGQQDLEENMYVSVPGLERILAELF